MTVLTTTQVISRRKANELNFWFIVQDSLKRAEDDKGHKEAYLMNATIMAVSTLESLLNNLAEFYLPESVYTSFDEKKQSSTDRYKEAVKLLTGQSGEFNKGNPKQVIGVSKIDISDFFNSEDVPWAQVCDLTFLRNEICHYKTECDVTELNGDRVEKIKEVKPLDIASVPQLISSLETFFSKLKELLDQSIEDYLQERYEHFFIFRQQNKSNEQQKRIKASAATLGEELSYQTLIKIQIRAKKIIDIYKQLTPLKKVAPPKEYELIYDTYFTAIACLYRSLFKGLDGDRKIDIEHLLEGDERLDDNHKSLINLSDRDFAHLDKNSKSHKLLDVEALKTRGHSVVVSSSISEDELQRTITFLEKTFLPLIEEATYVAQQK